MKNRRKIKQLIINPKFQLHMMGMFGLVLLLFAVLNYIAVSYVFVKMQNWISEKSIIDSSDMLGASKIFLSDLNQYLTLSLLFTAIIFIFYAVIFSHRIAGPMMRLKRHFRELATRPEGMPWHMLYFRKGDYFKDVEESINELATRENEKR